MHICGSLDLPWWVWETPRAWMALLQTVICSRSETRTLSDGCHELPTSNA